MHFAVKRFILFCCQVWKNFATFLVEPGWLFLYYYFRSKSPKLTGMCLVRNLPMGFPRKNPRSIFFLVNTFSNIHSRLRSLDCKELSANKSLAEQSLKKLQQQLLQIKVFCSSGFFRRFACFPGSKMKYLEKFDKNAVNSVLVVRFR